MHPVSCRESSSLYDLISILVPWPDRLPMPTPNSDNTVKCFTVITWYPVVEPSSVSGRISGLSFMISSCVQLNHDDISPHIKQATTANCFMVKTWYPVVESSSVSGRISGLSFMISSCVQLNHDDISPHIKQATTAKGFVAETLRNETAKLYF